MRVQNRVSRCFVVTCFLANYWLGCLANSEYDRVIEKNRKTFESKAKTGHKEIVCEKLRVTVWPKENQATTKNDDNNYEAFHTLEGDNQLKSSKDQAIGRSTRNSKNSHESDDDYAFDAAKKILSPESSWTSVDESLFSDATDSENEMSMNDKYGRSQRRKKLENYLVNSIVNILVDVNNLMRLNQMIFTNLKAELMKDYRDGCVDCRSVLGASENHYLEAQSGLCGALERGTKLVRSFVKEPRKMLALGNIIVSKMQHHHVRSYADSLKNKLMKLLSRVEDCLENNEDKNREDRVKDVKKYLSSLRVKKFDILDDLATNPSQYLSAEGANTAVAPNRSYFTNGEPKTRRISPSKNRDTRTQILSTKNAEKMQVFDSLLKFLRGMPKIISAIVSLFDACCLAGSLSKKSDEHPSIVSSPVYDEEKDVFEAAHGINSHRNDNVEDKKIFMSDFEKSDGYSDYDDRPTKNHGISHSHDFHDLSADLSPLFFENGEIDRGFMSFNPKYGDSAETTIDLSNSNKAASKYFSSLFPYCSYLKKIMNQRSIDSHGNAVYSGRRYPHSQTYDWTSSTGDFDVIGSDIDDFSSNGNNDRTRRRIRLRLPLNEARVSFGTEDANYGDYFVVNLGKCTLIGKFIEGSDSIDLRIIEGPSTSLRPNVENADKIWKVSAEKFINFVSRDVLKKLRETCGQRYAASSKRHRYVRTTAEYERDYDF